MVERSVTFFDAYPHVYGGAQRTLHILARELVAAGWTVTILVPHAGPLTERLGADGLQARVIEPPAALRHYGGATRRWKTAAAMIALPKYWLILARALRADRGVVHVNDLRGMLLAGPAARLAGRRLVWQIHALSADHFLLRAGAFLAARIVVPTQATMVQLHGLPAARTTVVANAVESQFQPPAAPMTTDGAPTIVSAGRIDPIKGFDVLLAAFARVHADWPDAHLQILGDPQLGHERYAEGLRAQSHGLGLDAAVTFAGFIPRPEEAFATAVVYVQPSHQETFGLAVAEAMACGLPVVATRVGGLAEVVVDGETGLLVPDGDAGALGDAIGRLLADPDLASDLGRAGRLRALKEFSTEAMVARMQATYEEACA